MTVTVTTGFGYVTDNNGHIIGKYSQQNLGSLVIPDGFTYTEVADQTALNLIQIYIVPVSGFNVDLFCEALFTSFGADSNVLPYYAVLKDLAVFQNFYGMKTIVAALLAATILTQDEVNTLNAVLATQNIVLSTFSAPS